MPGLKLYVDYFSQPCRSVLALCEFKKIPVETVELRVNKKQVNSIIICSTIPNIIKKLIPCKWFLLSKINLIISIWEKVIQL
jgi:hypothetical protein